MAGRGIGATLTVLLFTSISGFAAARPNDPRPVGYLAVSGEVWVDHQVAPTGTAVFAGDSIATGKGSAAEVRLPSGASATLSENGELTLAPEAGSPTFRLSKGAVAVRHPGGDAARVQVPGATIVVQGESGFPALCRIASAGNGASIIADRGHIEVHGRGAPQLLRPGKSLRLEAGMPQAAGQHAGQVSNAIPEEMVHPARGSRSKCRDGVNWEDVVRTSEERPRAHRAAGRNGSQRRRPVDDEDRQARYSDPADRNRAAIGQAAGPGGETHQARGELSDQNQHRRHWRGRDDRDGYGDPELHSRPLSGGDGLGKEHQSGDSGRNQPRPRTANQRRAGAATERCNPIGAQ